MRFNSSAGFQDYEDERNEDRRSKNKDRNGCVAQAAEQTSHKREVGGSNPPTATKLIGLVM